MSLNPNTVSPAVGTYERMEPRSRKREFHETMRGEVHDPLWILTQQWRVGEFNAEDAGTVVKARIMLNSSKLDLFQGPNSGIVDYDNNIPLEARVEQLPLVHDVSSSLQLGTKWLKLLRKHALGSSYDALFLTAFPLKESIKPEHKAHRESFEIKKSMIGKTPDGAQIMTYIEKGNDIKDLTFESLSIPSPDHAAIDAAQADFTNWYSSLYMQPSTDEECWSDERLEYSFKMSAPDASDAGATEDVFSGAEYQKGKLDWYSIDVTAESRLDPTLNITASTDSITTETTSFIPNNISAKGLPTQEWWEMEEDGIDLANMLSRKNEISKLVLSQFAVNYSNDWFIIPHTREVGSINKVGGLMTTDVFGKSLMINSAGNGLESWEKWSMYQQEGDSVGDVSLLLPTVIKNVESEPIEQVVFLRDEMSNMVWAVEDIIPDYLGGGRPGKDAFQELQEYLASLYQYVSDANPDNFEETAANIKFQLGTTVPENWIPFIPVASTGSNMQLQRAAMSRFIEGLDLVHTDNIVRPRTALLSKGIDQNQPYKIYEEEILKAGIIVTTHYQRTRWFDGSNHVWLGRKKKTGRGTGESGLIFDQIVPKDEIETA